MRRLTVVLEVQPNAAFKSNIQRTALSASYVCTKIQLAGSIQGGLPCCRLGPCDKAESGAGHGSYRPHSTTHQHHKERCLRERSSTVIASIQRLSVRYRCVPSGHAPVESRSTTSDYDEDSASCEDQYHTMNTTLWPRSHPGLAPGYHGSFVPSSMDLVGEARPPRPLCGSRMLCAARSRIRGYWQLVWAPQYEPRENKYSNRAGTYVAHAHLTSASSVPPTSENKEDSAATKQATFLLKAAS